MEPTDRGSGRAGAVIIGAGGHGRGVLETLLRARPDCPVVGFLDDDPSRTGDRIEGIPVLGPVDWLREHAGSIRRVYLGLGAPSARRAVAQRLTGLPLSMPPLVHPAACLHGGVSLGEGTVIGAGAVVAHDTRIGRRVLVNLNATVGHDVTIGDDVSVGPGANVAGGVRIGEGAFIGMNATVIPGITVGSWSEVAAASAVLRDVPAGHRVLGNPARDLGAVESP